MNRKHTAQDYLDVIERIRAVRPDIALSGDFIVGFPEETEEDFQATLELCKQVRYAHAYSFKYSPRPGTPAANRSDVSEDEKSDRLQRLQALLTQHQTEFQNAQIGQIVKVLLEKDGRKDGQLVGKSEYLQAVHVQAERKLIGKVVSVHVDVAGRNSLNGTIIDTH